MIHPSPALVDLIVELHQLGAADRYAILERLEPQERELIEAHLKRAAQRPEPSFDALAALSPWLADSLMAARAGQATLARATCEALIDAERLLPSKAEPLNSVRPSLLQRLFSRTAAT
jgi:hypothetical protein